MNCRISLVCTRPKTVNYRLVDGMWNFLVHLIQYDGRNWIENSSKQDVFFNFSVFSGVTQLKETSESEGDSEEDDSEGDDESEAEDSENDEDEDDDESEDHDSYDENDEDLPEDDKGLFCLLSFI